MLENQITNFDEIKNFFESIENRNFSTNTNAKGLYTIQQTERNNLKNASLEVFANMLNSFVEQNEIGANVDIIADGIAVSVYNDKLEQEVVFLLNPTIPALANNGTPFDVAFEAQEYAKQMADKAQQKQAKEQAKREKAQRDARLREQAKQKREEQKGSN